MATDPVGVDVPVAAFTVAVIDTEPSVVTSAGVTVNVSDVGIWPDDVLVQLSNSF